MSKWETIIESLTTLGICLCRRCKYCRYIDVDGEINCELGIKGKAKLYCSEYVPKESKKEG